MSSTKEEFLEAVWGLPRDEQIELAHQVLEGVSDEEQQEIDRVWGPGVTAESPIIVPARPRPPTAAKSSRECVRDWLEEAQYHSLSR
jgi:hypothetical protein